MEEEGEGRVEVTGRREVVRPLAFVLTLWRSVASNGWIEIAAVITPSLDTGSDGVGGGRSDSGQIPFID